MVFTYRNTTISFQSSTTAGGIYPNSDESVLDILREIKKEITTEGGTFGHWSSLGINVFYPVIHTQLRQH